MAAAAVANGWRRSRAARAAAALIQIPRRIGIAVVTGIFTIPSLFQREIEKNKANEKNQ